MEVEDIAKILKFDDPVFEDTFPCAVGDWVQFLMQHVDNPKLLLLGIFEDDGDFIGYVVAYNSVLLPISRHITILYYTGNGFQDADEGIEIIKDFATEANAESIRFQTKKPDEFEKYGFTSYGTMMGLEI